MRGLADRIKILGSGIQTSWFFGVQWSGRAELGFELLIWERLHRIQMMGSQGSNIILEQNRLTLRGFAYA